MTPAAPMKELYQKRNFGIDQHNATTSVGIISSPLSIVNRESVIMCSSSWEAYSVAYVSVAPVNDMKYAVSVIRKLLLS